MSYTLRATRRAAFTLIELMVVMVILGILAALVMPRILNYPERARRDAARVQIRILEGAVTRFKVDTGEFPTTGQGLRALVEDPGVRGWNPGGYLEKGRVPLDPWGSPYIYIYPGRHNTDFDIISRGKDGEPGGTGYDADIESWDLDKE